MNALDSSLEVLALDYLGFGLLTVVNNVWTWVAVITAAVSVWKIRSSSPRDHFPSEVPLIKPAIVLPAASTPVKVEAPRPSRCVFNSEGRTSGKFTFYYVREEEEEEEEANVDDDGDVDRVDGTGEKKLHKLEPVRNGWEVMMEMRMRDHTGFYSYQDPTMLDGNVVRLWDGCRRGKVINSARIVRCGGNDW